MQVLFNARASGDFLKIFAFNIYKIFCIRLHAYSFKSNFVFADCAKYFAGSASIIKILCKGQEAQALP